MTPFIYQSFVPLNLDWKRMFSLFWVISLQNGPLRDRYDGDGDGGDPSSWWFQHSHENATIYRDYDFTFTLLSGDCERFNYHSNYWYSIPVN